MYVCDQCIAEPALQEFIRDHALSETCDYCGRDAETAIACSLDELVEEFAAGISVDWADALEFMPQDGGDWAFPEAHTDIWDLLDGFEIEMHDELRTDIINRFEDISYAPRHFFGYSPDERLIYGWEGFADYVSHRARFLFLTAEDDGNDPGVVGITQMLRALGQAIVGGGLVVPLEEGVRLFRARLHTRAERPASAGELGTPTPDRAKLSSRMSPNGIPMFYGARERDTALAETVAGGWPQGHAVTLATFEASDGFNIVDLFEPPLIPSVFDAARRDLIAPLRFLHRFVEEVRKPIRRDDREHIEYVPTQIVAEYFRDLYERETGERVDGIAYRSAVIDGGANVVLFAENADCVDAFPPAAQRKLRLAGWERLRRPLFGRRSFS
jgi:hypothetical protein